ncbi:MAG: gamma-glutamyl-gamma-aminobutyrate hydrolase family protein [Planctomycetes bacterium]|nr:gamma-glutamyl-gamma-aminobutyrate hydrolase family protein [Planctomycetota bacterium]
MTKPIIGINANLTREKYDRVHQDYSRAVVKAGGVPLILPIVTDFRLIAASLKKIDGLILSGSGFDINPKRYQEKILSMTKLVSVEKELFDLALVRYALKKKIPILGTCYGIQLLNVAQGGSLIQHIPLQLKNALPHQPNRSHLVYFSEASKLYQIVKQKAAQVNTAHHQAIKRVGRGLTINARSEDGLIEGVEWAKPDQFVQGIQWHPERMIKHPAQLAIFKALVKASRR